MPIQYLYPSGDNASNYFFSQPNTALPLYSMVDEGTVTPNDSDYLICPIVYPRGAGTGPLLYLSADRPFVIPNGVGANSNTFMNIRCRVQGGAGFRLPTIGYGYRTLDASGTAFNMWGTAVVDITNSGGYQTISLPLDGTNTSGNVAGQFVTPFNPAFTYMYLLPDTIGINNSTLYISAMEIVVSGDNVFDPHGGIDLYTQGPIPFSGTLNNPTMYIDGPEPSSGTITLYINGVVPTGLADGIPLYTVGKAPISGGVDLYIQSQSNNLNNDLFIAGHLPINTFTTLFVSGDFPHASMPLFIPGKVPVPSSGFATFYTYSTLNSGVFGSTNLSITSTNTAGSLPLYIKAKDGDNNQYLPLMVKCDNTSQNNTQLYIANNNQTTHSGINLRVNGAGQNAGWNTDNDSMYLFINRANDAVANNVGLYVEGPDGGFTSTPLMISGGYVVNNNMNLVVPNSIGPIHGNTSLYNHGF